MAWYLSHRCTNGLTKDMLFSAVLGNPDDVKHWQNPPRPNLQAGSDLIECAEWENGEPWNTWVPMGVEISMTTIGAMAVDTWYDAFEFVCNSNDGVYIAFRIRRMSSALPTLPVLECVLVKRVKNGETITDTDISYHRNFTIYNDTTITYNDGKIHFYFGSFTYGQNTFYGAGLCVLNIYTYGSTTAFFTNGEMFASERGIFWNKIGTAEPEGDLQSPEFGEPSKPDGGYNPDLPHGNFDFSSDEIPIDPKPSLGVSSMGFINVYKIEPNELQRLGEKLFPHFLPAEILGDPSQLSVSEMLAMFLKVGYGTLLSPAGSSIDITDNLGVFDILMNGKLIDYVLDCHVIPTSISGATVAPLKIGYKTFQEFQLAKATEDYVDVDCGELSLDECFGNFLDYNCAVEIYLPFVGFVPLSNEYWNNATIKVVYRFNIVDGSFQAKLVTTRRDEKMQIKNSVIGQYGGVCCVHFPLTGMQYSNVVSGLVNGSLSVATHAGAGDTAGVATNAMKMATLRPDAPMSNGYNASSSFLSHRTPYLVIKRNAPQFSETYNKEMGLPLNVTFTLSSVHGFTTVDNPVLNISCSDDEYNEIVTLLKNGVILP